MFFDYRKINYKKIIILKRVYAFLLIILLILIVITPDIIKSKILFFEEEFVEGFLLFVLSLISYYVSILYQREINKVKLEAKKSEKEKKDLEKSLTEAFKYIGSINVQIGVIKSVFSKINKYPKNKKEMKQIMEFLANSILGIIPVDWVVLRIVNLDNARTIREFSQARGTAVILKHEISNNDLLNEKYKEGNCDYNAIASQAENTTFKVFCIFPSYKLKESEKEMLKALVTQLEMLFIIFTSKYYKYREDN